MLLTTAVRTLSFLVPLRLFEFSERLTFSDDLTVDESSTDEAELFNLSFLPLLDDDDDEPELVLLDGSFSIRDVWRLKSPGVDD